MARSYQGTMHRELKLFSGTANPALAREMGQYLDIPVGEATVSSFSDGEIRVKIEENVRGADVFVVQSCCQPVNDSIMELLIMIDALKRSSASRITARWRALWPARSADFSTTCSWRPIYVAEAWPKRSWRG